MTAARAAASRVAGRLRTVPRAVGDASGTLARLRCNVF